MAPGVTDEDGRGSRSPAGREQIIQQHNPFICAYTIDMHLHFSFAVLERVLSDLRLIGKLAAFANRNETDAHQSRQFCRLSGRDTAPERDQSTHGTTPDHSTRA